MNTPLEERLVDTFKSLAVNPQAPDVYVANVIRSVQRRNREQRLLFVSFGLAVALFIGFGLWMVRPLSPTITTAASEPIEELVPQGSTVEPIVLSDAQLGRPSWDSIIGTFIADVALNMFTVVALGVAAYLSLYLFRRYRGVPIDRRWSVVALFATAIVAAIVLRMTVQAYWLASDAMAPTLPLESRVLVAHNDTDVEVGDIVLVRSNAFEAGPEPLFEEIILRVAGLEGDVVEGRDGVLMVNQRPMINPLLADGSGPELEDFAPVAVGPGEVFLIADNFAVGLDSRSRGTVQVDDIKASIRWRFVG